jgi:hypothetical protein
MYSVHFCVLWSKTSMTIRLFFEGDNFSGSFWDYFIIRTLLHWLPTGQLNFTCNKKKDDLILCRKKIADGIVLHTLHFGPCTVLLAGQKICRLCLYGKYNTRLFFFGSILRLSSALRDHSKTQIRPTRSLLSQLRIILHTFPTVFREQCDH